MKTDLSFHGTIAGMIMALATIADLELAIIHVEAPYLVLMLGVIVAFALGGALSAALSIALAAIVTWYFFMPPFWSFQLPSYEYCITYGLLLGIMVLVCRLLAVQRRRIDELASTNTILRNQLVKAGLPG
jgi:K+-sensing histidine kinase KdpD